MFLKTNPDRLSDSDLFFFFSIALLPFRLISYPFREGERFVILKEESCHLICEITVHITDILLIISLFFVES